MAARPGAHRVGLSPADRPERARLSLSHLSPLAGPTILGTAQSEQLSGSSRAPRRESAPKQPRDARVRPARSMLEPSSLSTQRPQGPRALHNAGRSSGDAVGLVASDARRASVHRHRTRTRCWTDCRVRAGPWSRWLDDCASPEVDSASHPRLSHEAATSRGCGSIQGFKVQKSRFRASLYRLTRFGHY